MTFQKISQRGKEYLKTAETLFRAAQTMTDLVVANQLKALADDYQRRAEKELQANRSRAEYHIRSARIEDLQHAQQ
jgi:hypothetical protein